MGSSEGPGPEDPGGGAGSDAPGGRAEGEPVPEGGGLRETADDALRRLEQRLDRASDAAERLFAEARTAARDQPPPAGWQVPAAEGQSTGPGELELLAGLLSALRELIPPDLQRRLAEALRELLMAVRALIDWYLERTERRRTESADVQDIPIL